MTTPAPEYVLARRVLLDALDALESHRSALVLVGAQAVYLRVGDAGLAVTPYTTDADLGILPEFLAAEPEITACLTRAGFRPGSASTIGVWISEHHCGGRLSEVQVDLLVPDAVGGGGRRAARLPPHHERAFRKVRGLEGALFDRSPATICALDEADPRRDVVNVAGPAALLVAKSHKILERIGDPKRRRTIGKDALDVFRLLRGAPEGETAEALRRLLALASSSSAAETATASVTREALTFLQR